MMRFAVFIDLTYKKKKTAGFMYMKYVSCRFPYFQTFVPGILFYTSFVEGVSIFFCIIEMLVISDRKIVSS